MKQTRLINVTGKRDFSYVMSHKTNVAATIRKWLTEYGKSWDCAHAEEAERESQMANVRPMKKAVAK